FRPASATSSEPKRVLIYLSGDVEAYLSRVESQPKPRDIDSHLVRDDSLSVTRGDQIPINYYGVTDKKFDYGNGIGWRSQESWDVADGWPRKY
ncbi:hypothetical protein LZ31DRAFT_433444, partial [Colletotrichum somersetense]